MAGYQSGSFTSFADLQSAILTFLQTQGWTLSSTVLSKGAGFFQFTNSATDLKLLGGTGQSGSALTGTPSATSFVRFLSGNQPLVFPATYEFHYFNNPDEFFCVINYSGVFYQHMAFGQSANANIGGTGWWYTGMYTNSATVNTIYCRDINNNNVAGGTVGYNATGAMMFMSLEGVGGFGYINHALDSAARWSSDGGITVNNSQGGGFNWSLMQATPNAMNGATVLHPVKVMHGRTAGNWTELFCSQNIRMTRNDNVDPGGIITLGSDKWKVYPWFSKNTSVRGGVGWSTGALHTGTFAWAIRYQGP